MENIEQTICEILNQYCFDNIWNEGVSEYRSNVQPTLLAERSRVGSIIVSGYVVTLPKDSVPFYIYGISISNLHGTIGVLSTPEEWTSTDTLCSKNKLVLNMFTNEGKMFHKDRVFVKLSPTRNMLLIATETQMVTKLIDYSKIRDVYTTVYYDSDRPNDVTIKSFKISKDDIDFTERLMVQNYIDSLEHLSKCTIYVNGYEVELDGMDDIPTDSYIDVVYDENIQFNFELDISDYEQIYTFFSEKDSTHKRIIHIPKHLNNDNKVITHNTCDIFIRMKKPDTYKNKGLYVHRCANRAISQITHNDFGMPMYIEDDYRDYLKTQDIVIKVIGRIHDKNNVLIRDKSYIDLLYTHSDIDILQLLKGKESLPQLDFWKAVNLEKSKYVEMMFDVPNIITPETMFEYVEGLGYYHTISLVCTTVKNEIAKEDTKLLFIQKPYLYHKQLTYPIVYKDGFKIDKSNYTVHTSNTENCVIRFNSDYIVEKDSLLTSIIYMDGVTKSYRFTPDYDNRSITIPYKTFVLYEELYLHPIECIGMDSVSKYSYKELTNFINKVIVEDNNNGTVTLHFASVLNGCTFIIQNKQCVTELTPDLDSKIVPGSPLVFNLEVSPLVEITGHNVPIFKIDTAMIYLNGKYLINKLDYHIVDVTDRDGNISLRQLVIQNVSYLKDTGNSLEVILHTSSNEDTGYDFIMKQRTNYNNKPNLWFPSMSTLHADGKLMHNVVNMGSYLQLSDSTVREGAPYEIQTNIPTIVKEFVNKYHENDDKDRLVILNHYFFGIGDPPPPIIVIPESHQIYSTYMAIIIRDILKRTLVVSLDPDISKLILQLEDYDKFKRYDQYLLYPIDFRFVDTHPTFRNFTTTDPQLFKVIHSLIKILMPKDKINSGEIVYEHR